LKIAAVEGNAGQTHYGVLFFNFFLRYCINLMLDEVITLLASGLAKNGHYIGLFTG
jgi:hypothetical protein